MKNREPIQIDIEHLSADGCGYSADGRYAVYGALAGETVTAAPVTRKRKRLYLKTSHVHVAAADRTEPFCKAASHCGGCSFQHLAHKSQLQLKEDLLRSELAPLIPDQWLLPLTGASTYHYRSKARLGVKFVEKKGRVLVGFREKGKPYITDIDSCPILSAGMSDMISPLEDLVSSLGQSRAVPQIEIASGDSRTAMVIRHLEALGANDLEALAAFGEKHAIEIYLQPKGPDSVHRIYPDDQKTGYLSYRLDEYDLEFNFAPLDFTQVNLDLNAKMVAAAIELLDLKPDDTVLDAFCGIGNFSLAVARSVKHVIGVEQSATSIDRARLNAANNGIKNVQFEVADLHEDPPEVPDFTGVNKVLLDPPRSGALALMKKLASSNVEKVVYVSCNPETLARDVKFLNQQGYSLRSAGIIDMFPHTTHVESIALLDRQVSDV